MKHTVKVVHDSTPRCGAGITIRLSDKLKELLAKLPARRPEEPGEEISRAAYSNLVVKIDPSRTKR